MDHRTCSAARSAAKELTALEVHTAQRVTKHSNETVAVASLNIGDILMVPTGARVPVDGLLVSSKALMDRSILTGETAAIKLAQDAPLRAGEINIAAALKMRATAVGQDTSLRRMAAMVETAENGRNSYTALADKAAQIYAPAVHLLALLAFAGWVGTTGDIRHALNVAIAVLIITCPCALGLAVPAVTTAAISRLFSMGYLVKHATALERLAEVTRVVFDKTGTLSVASIILSKSLSSTQAGGAKALAQASLHPLSRALETALHDVKAANVTDIVETEGQGSAGIWNGRTVRLGRGVWLGAPFDDLGLKIGDEPAYRLQSCETPR